MLKKVIIVFVLVFIVTAVAVGCGTSSQPPDQASTPEPTPAPAQTPDPTPAAPAYPTKAIEIVVPFNPGGSSDLSARILAAALEKKLGQPIMINNLPGANGITGTNYVVNAKKDGYTLSWISSRPLIPEMFSSNPPYTSADLVPISEVCETAGAIMVHADSEFETLDEFIDYLKANPGIKFGHSGKGNKNHLTSMLLAKEYGLDIVDVPFEGDNGAITALLRKDVEFIMAGAIPAMAQIEAGLVRPLVILSDERVVNIPDIPIISETSYPVTNIISFIGLFAPVGTPNEIIELINSKIAECFEDESFVQSLADVGLSPTYRNGEDFAKVIKDFDELVSPMVLELGLYD